MALENRTKPFEAVYLPVGVPTFHLESAQKEFEASRALLRGISDAVAVPGGMLLSLDALQGFLQARAPDLVIFQNITFANAAYISEVLAVCSCPVVLWTLREPVIDGGRLRLNSLTGAYSAANTLRALRTEPFTYVFGAPGEEEVRQTLAAAVCAAQLKHRLRSLRMAAVGHTPEGFGFGRALDSELRGTFGVRLESIEARELIEKARGYTEAETREYLDLAETRMLGLDKMPEQNRTDFARLYRAYTEYVGEKGVGALASRCWPDFFTAFGTPVCAVLSILNDLGVAAACEGDLYGALSMYLAMQATGQPAFFGDPVSLDETENTLTFWHCGMAACSLARRDTGACTGVHCNRKIGPTMEFGCRPAPAVTVFRIGKKPDGGFRFLVARGQALEKPRQFYGTSVVVKTEFPVRALVEQTVRGGWEPHFAVAYGDAARVLKILGDMLNIEVQEY